MGYYSSGVASGGGSGVTTYPTLATSTAASAAGVITMTKPSGIANNDWLLFITMSSDNTDWGLSTPDDGFKRIAAVLDTDINDRSAIVYAKKITNAAGEPASYTFDFSTGGSADNYVGILVHISPTSGSGYFVPVSDFDADHGYAANENWQAHSFLADINPDADPVDFDWPNSTMREYPWRTYQDYTLVFSFIGVNDSDFTVAETATAPTNLATNGGTALVNTTVTASIFTALAAYEYDSAGQLSSADRVWTSPQTDTAAGRSIVFAIGFKET